MRVNSYTKRWRWQRTRTYPANAALAQSEGGVCWFLKGNALASGPLRAARVSNGITLSPIALTDNIAIACRLMATQPYQFTVMAHFNIIDRIYFAGERSQDRGDRKVSGPGGIMAGLLFPLLILLDKLNKLHLLPLGKQLSVLYVCGCFCALFFGIWGYYVKSGRHERVMNYYRGRATDTPAYNYAYIIGWIIVCVVVTLIIAQCNISLPLRRVL